MASASTVCSRCRILYSTQSGRAKACARRTARLVAEQYGDSMLQNGAGSTVDLDEWTMEGSNNSNPVSGLAERLRESQALLILFVSTTGDGEHTDTIQRMWKNLLQKSLPHDTFEGVRFAIFSLGDRAYGPQKFCAAGRKLTVRLRQLGASLAMEPGFGDDGTPNGGVFRDLDHWLETTLLPALVTILPAPNASDSSIPLSPANRVPCSPPYSVKVASGRKLNVGLTHEEEWQLDRYAAGYRSFFERQQPLSAYTYDKTTHQRMFTNNSDHDKQNQQQLLVGRVVENRRLTAVDWEQNTFHLRIEVDYAASCAAVDPVMNGRVDVSLMRQYLDSLPYRAGDVAAILPSNSVEDVTAFLNVLPRGLCDMADDELCIDNDNSSSFDPQNQRFPGHGYTGWPRLCTLRGWLTYCADVHGLPEREDLRALAPYCSLDHEHGADQRDKLVALSETQASALYADYVLREKRTWRDVLYDFDSLRHEGSHLTVEALLGLLPPIRYREFSIASSPSKIRQETKSASMLAIELCVAVVEGTTRLGRTYHGLCSHYLSQLSDNGSAAIQFWIRPGSFHGLPLQCAPGSLSLSPVIYIGAGTGIAPLRSLIQERDAILEMTASATMLSNASQQNNGDEEGLERSDILVFGCRKREADFYYAAEWNMLRHSGRLGLLVAFSRDQWHKIYVQQVIQVADQDTNLLSRHILERSGSIYIAGGPLMARSVKEVILESVAKEIGGGDKQAPRILTKMQQNGRFSIEAWN